MIRAAGVALFAVAALLTFRDLFMSTNGNNGADADHRFEPPKMAAQVPKLKKSFMGPTLKFLFCYS
jgi:hypothetical protein